MERRAFHDCHDDAGGRALRDPELGFDLSGSARRHGVGAIADPVRTIFLAKVTAVATALSVTIATLHLFAGFVWPLALNHRHEATIAPSISYEAAMAPLDVAALSRFSDRTSNPR